MNYFVYSQSFAMFYVLITLKTIRFILVTLTKYIYILAFFFFTFKFLSEYLSQAS